MGDTSVLERLSAHELTLVNRYGRTYTKAEFLADACRAVASYVDPQADNHPTCRNRACLFHQVP